MNADHPAVLGVLFLLVGAVGPSRGEDLELVRDGRSNSAIVVSSSASPSERRGAKELRSHLKKRTGADLPTDPKTHRPIAASRPAGAWNHVRIVCRGPHVEHWLNSVKICEYEIGSADWNRRVVQSGRGEFPNFGRNRAGHIALQAQSGSISFANIRLLPLEGR